MNVQVIKIKETSTTVDAIQLKTILTFCVFEHDVEIQFHLYK